MIPQWKHNLKGNKHEGGMLSCDRVPEELFQSQRHQGSARDRMIPLNSSVAAICLGAVKVQLLILTNGKVLYSNGISKALVYPAVK